MRALKLAARAPRLALLGACTLLALAGLRTTLTGGGAAPPPRAASAPMADRSVAAFAEAFARLYLSYDDDEDLGARERALDAYIGDRLDPDAGLQPPAGRSQQVTWTAASHAVPAGTRRWLVTVAAATDTDKRLRYLSVPVAQDMAGGLLIEDYPALIGAPARAVRGAQPSETELTDQALADVVARALGNYLSAARENLRADLAPGVSLTTPSPPLRLLAVEALAWRTPGRLLAATLTAQERSGARMRLRFLLTVARRDRWYLRAVNAPSTTTEGTR